MALFNFNFGETPQERALAAAQDRQATLERRTQASQQQLAQSLQGTPGPFASGFFPLGGLDPQAQPATQQRLLENFQAAGGSAEQTVNLAQVQDPVAAAQRAQLAQAERTAATTAQQRAEIGLRNDELTFDRDTFAFRLEREEANQRAASGFDNPQQAIDFGQTLSVASGALAAVDQMLFIRDQLGAIGPLDFMQNPEAAAAVDLFQSFETILLFKNLAQDQRVSDEDREFYSGLVELGVADFLFSGGRVEVAKLKQLQERLEGTMAIFRTHPGSGMFENLFDRKRFGEDIGVPFVPPTFEERFQRGFDVGQERARTRREREAGREVFTPRRLEEGF